MLVPSHLWRVPASKCALGSLRPATYREPLVGHSFAAVQVNHRVKIRSVQVLQRCVESAGSHLSAATGYPGADVGTLQQIKQRHAATAFQIYGPIKY